MADITNLTNFLQDVADAIKEKKEYESTQKIAAEDFDTEILSIETGIDTSDATATANDVLSPKVFYNAEGRQVGGMSTVYEKSDVTSVNLTIDSSLGYTIIAVDYKHNIVCMYNTYKISSTNIGYRVYFAKIINGVIDYETIIQASNSGYADFTNSSKQICADFLETINDNTVSIVIGWTRKDYGVERYTFTLTAHTIDLENWSVVTCTLNSSITFSTSYYVNVIARPNHPNQFAVITVQRSTTGDTSTTYIFEIINNGISKLAQSDTNKADMTSSTGPIMYRVHFSPDGNYLYTAIRTSSGEPQNGRITFISDANIFTTITDETNDFYYLVGDGYCGRNQYIYILGETGIGENPIGENLYYDDYDFLDTFNLNSNYIFINQNIFKFNEETKNIEMYGTTSSTINKYYASFNNIFWKTGTTNNYTGYIVQESNNLIKIIRDNSSYVLPVDTTATVYDILSPKTAYINGMKQMGAIGTIYEKGDVAEKQMAETSYVIYSDRYPDAIDFNDNLFVKHSFTDYGSTGGSRTWHINTFKINDAGKIDSNKLSPNISGGGKSSAQWANCCFLEKSTENKISLAILIYNSSYGGLCTQFCCLDLDNWEVIRTTSSGAAKVSSGASGIPNGNYVIPRPGYPNQVLQVYRVYTDSTKTKVNEGFALYVFDDSSGQIITKFNKLINSELAFVNTRPLVVSFSSDGNYLSCYSDTNGCKCSMFYIEGDTCSTIYEVTAETDADIINTHYILVGNNYCIKNQDIYELTGLNIGTDVVGHSYATFPELWTILTGNNNQNNSTPSLISKIFVGDNNKLYKFNTTTKDLEYYIQSAGTIRKGSYSFNTMYYKIGTSEYQDNYGGYYLTETNNLVGLTRNNKTFIQTVSGNVAAGDIKLNKIAYGPGGKIIGTMPDNGSLTYTPSTSQQTIPAGYTSGGTIAAIILPTPDQIVSGNTIYGVVGTGAVSFATEEELNSHTNYPENTIAIVYGTKYIGTYKMDSGSWTQIGDTTEEFDIMETLNKIENYTDEYEGVGGTDEQLNEKINQLIGGEE